MEYLYFNADGTIKFITPGMQGVVAPGLPYYKVEAENYDTMFGAQTETCSDTNQGYDLGSIGNGGFAVYKNMKFGSGAIGFQARVASANSGGNIEIRLDSLSGTLVGTCAVTGTGAWQTWVTKSCSISGASGTHNLYLKAAGNSGYLFNINWFKFTPTTTQTISPVLAPAIASGRTVWKASIFLNTGAAAITNSRWPTAIESRPSMQLYDALGKRLFLQSKAATAGKRASAVYVYPCVR
jgi:hypothetical protein